MKSNGQPRVNLDSTKTCIFTYTYTIWINDVECPFRHLVSQTVREGLISGAESPKRIVLTPRKINMEPKNHPIEKKIIFQTFTLGFHVNFPGCRFHYQKVSQDSRPEGFAVPPKQVRSHAADSRCGRCLVFREPGGFC